MFTATATCEFKQGGTVVTRTLTVDGPSAIEALIAAEKKVVAEAGKKSGFRMVSVVLNNPHSHVA